MTSSYSSLPFNERLGKAGYKHVYWKIGDVKYVNLEALERMNLHSLQKKLLKEVGGFLRKPQTNPSMDERTSDELNRLLHEYCQAVQDRRFMTLMSHRGEKSNPFILRSDRVLEGLLMTEEIGISADNVLEAKEAELIPELPAAPWDYLSMQKRTFSRHAAGPIGALILIGPMIWMVLVRGVLCRLLTTALCTLVFAIVNAFLSSRTPIELMTVTAAYAGVFMVFVGAVIKD